LGVFISVGLELCGVASLPFAVGVYLPLSSSTPIFFGGMIRWIVEKTSKKKRTAEEAETSPGVLLSSGLIAGGSISGIGVAILSIKENWGNAIDMHERFAVLANSDWFPYIPFALMMFFVFATGREWILKPKRR
jgi:hypothetical protein